MFGPLKWKNNELYLIDQRKLPTEEIWIKCSTADITAEAIVNMTVRGAPAIGVTAAFGIVIGLLEREKNSINIDELRNYFYSLCDKFGKTRPTAVNLFWAIKRMRKQFDQLIEYEDDIERIIDLMIREAETIFKEDIATNQKIGENGLLFVEKGFNILTHCNAGALATAGYGTALGVIRSAHKDEKNIHVYVDETRPFLQGARLTAWELQKDNIPATLITDNMAGYLMSQGKIDMIVVGADRIARNGDTANKIGTYSLAVLADAHNIPFYIAAPYSTIDIDCKTGDDIPIEERDAKEVRMINGKYVSPEDISVYNPAFDVTPSRYIKAIITERGNLTEPFEENIKKLY